MALFRIVALLITLASLRVEAAELDALIGRDDLWQTSRADFVQQNRELGFRWVSAAQDAAETMAPGLTLFGNRVYQTTARFDADKLKQLTVSLYNRGDAGEMPKEKFDALLRATVEKLTAFTHAQFTARGKDAASAVKAEGLSWQNGTSNFVLEYSFTREVKTRNIPYRAEFMRLEITPVEKPQGLLSSAFAAKSQKFTGQSHVKRDPSGDVLLTDVPMVDQGEKGYCVVASAERVMRYYGTRADEHELAQIANTSAAAGTSNEAMFDALKKLSNRLRVKIRTIENFDVKHFLDLIKDYNHIAKRQHEQEIDTSSHMLNVSAIYAQMNPDVLREARTRNKSEPDRFLREVQTHIDDGIPLLWSVMLGIVHEEKAPQALGGHMRLIIGYNAKTREIMYSDSWGLGHELKRMALDDAWTITTGLNTIEPL